MDKLLTQQVLEKKDRYQLLFEEGKKRIENLDTLKKSPQSNECTFVPNMELTKSFNKKEFKHIIRTRVTERKVTKPEIYRNSSVDLNKCQRLHSPIKSERGSIGDLLHSHRKEKDKRRQIRSKLQEMEIHQEQNSRFVLSKSKQMFNSMKMNCFQNIFSALDSKGEGVISGESIDTEGIYYLNIIGINPKVLLVLESFFLNMKLTGQKLNKEEFIEELNKYFQELSITEKNVLLNFSKLNNSSETYEESSFSV